MSSSNNILSILGWTFLPNLVSSYLQKIYYGVTIRAGTPHPHPGSPTFNRDRRRIQIFVVSLYLLYTIYEADHNLRQTPNYYELLSVPFDATEREVKSRLRRLAALHHPDKATSGSTQEQHDFFIALQQAAETLANDATRFAYERFGPEIHAWKAEGKGRSLATIRDYMTKGLMLKIPYYVVGAVAMYAVSVLGYLSSARWWRWTFFVMVFAFEVFVVTRATFPPVLDRVLNPFFRTFTSHPPFLPFQLVALVRQISVTSYIAFNQLGPLLRPPTTQVPEEKEAEALAQGIDKLEQTVRVLHAEAGRLMDMELTPFVGDEAALKGLKAKTRDWLVQNTVRADPLVRDSIGNSVRRRRADVPHGAKGNR